MSDIEVPHDRESLRRKAAQHQAEKDNRKAVIFEAMETERSISDAKTAKLRELRLAKEAADAKPAKATAPAPKRRATVIHTH